MWWISILEGAVAIREWLAGLSWIWGGGSRICRDISILYRQTLGPLFSSVRAGLLISLSLSFLMGKRGTKPVFYLQGCSRRKLTLVPFYFPDFQSGRCSLSCHEVPHHQSWLTPCVRRPRWTCLLCSSVRTLEEHALLFSGEHTYLRCFFLPSSMNPWMDNLSKLRLTGVCSFPFFFFFKSEPRWLSQLSFHHSSV